MNVAVKIDADHEQLGPLYIETLTLVERVHHRLHQVVDTEFGRNNGRDVNSRQAMMVYRLGDQTLTYGALRNSGVYVGTNPSYNLKKLVDLGYIDHVPSAFDRRKVHLSLTVKGRTLRDAIEALLQRHITALSKVTGLTPADLKDMNDRLGRLDRFLTGEIVY